MSSPVTILEPNNTLIAASGIMNAMHIKQIPIVIGRSLAGIVTQTDIIRNVNKMLEFDVTYEHNQNNNNDNNQDHNNNDQHHG